MNPESLEQFRKHHRQRLQRQKQALEQKRQQILLNRGKAATALKRLGAQKLVVIGSILDTRRFHSRSDLDLIVTGLPLSRWSAAVLALEEIEEFADIVIDLKCAEEMSKDFLSYAESHGKRIL